MFPSCGGQDDDGVTCEDVVVVLSSEQRHHVGRESDLWNLGRIGGLQRGKLRAKSKRNAFSFCCLLKYKCKAQTFSPVAAVE